MKWGPDRVSNGPSGDIMMVSSLARAMVLRWGMSDKVGNIDYQAAHEGYAGNGAGALSISAATQELIEQEVKRVIDEGYDVAANLLKKHKKEFELLAQGLLEYETLTGEEIKRVMKGEPPRADDKDEDEGDTPSLTAIPKTKPKPKVKVTRKPKDDAMKPEPNA
jgi:cell division protease FtsH